jgi:hypothetical protein
MSELEINLTDTLSFSSAYFELSEGMETVASSFVGMQVFKVASEEIEGATLTPCAKGRR